MKRFLTATALALALCSPAAAYTQAALTTCSNLMGQAMSVGSAAAEEYKQTHMDLYNSNPLKWGNQWGGFTDRASYVQDALSAIITDMLNGDDDVDCAALFQKKFVPYIRGE